MEACNGSIDSPRGTGSAGHPAAAGGGAGDDCWPAPPCGRAGSRHGCRAGRPAGCSRACAGTVCAPACGRRRSAVPAAGGGCRTASAPANATAGARSGVCGSGGAAPGRTTAGATRAGAAAVAPEPALPNFIERGIGAVKRWFTEGNVPVKIGMLVLLAGVAALLKYVSDQGWLVLPIELRLAGVTVGALGLLAFGWHQRERRRLFALALQGGAIGVLLLTIFAAFKRFELLNPGLPSPVRSRWWPACACWRWCRTRARWRCWASSPASWHRCGCPPAVATTWGCSATTRCSMLASSPSPGSVRGVR